MAVALLSARPLPIQSAPAAERFADSAGFQTRPIRVASGSAARTADVRFLFPSKLGERNFQNALQMPRLVRLVIAVEEPSDKVGQQIRKFDSLQNMIVQIRPQLARHRRTQNDALGVRCFGEVAAQFWNGFVAGDLIDGVAADVVNTAVVSVSGREPLQVEAERAEVLAEDGERNDLKVLSAVPEKLAEVVFHKLPTLCDAFIGQVAG